MDEELRVSPLSKRQKGFIWFLVFMFVLLFLGEMLGVITLTTNGIAILIVVTVLLLLDIIPNYLESIKMGGIELEFKKLGQQQEFLIEIQQKITSLEEQLNQVKDTKDIDRLISRFEYAARRFNDGDLSERELSDQEMVFTGIQLGSDFLEERINSRVMGERAGAASAMGSLQNPDALGSLSNALRDRASFVRYRASKSIKKIADLLSDSQVDLVLETLETAVSRERNPYVSRMMLSTIKELNRL